MSLLHLAPSILHLRNCFLYLGNELPKTHRLVKSMAVSSMSPLLYCLLRWSLVCMLYLFRTNGLATFEYLLAYGSRNSFQLHKDHGSPKCWQAALQFVRLQVLDALIAKLSAPTAGCCSTSTLSEASCPALSSHRPSNASHLMSGLGRPDTYS
jgi:hypothetical protein